MQTKEVINQELENRMNEIERLLSSAWDCLKQRDDFTQCVVRLELIAEQGKFTSVFKDICEAETESDYEK